MEIVRKFLIQMNRLLDLHKRAEFAIIVYQWYALSRSEVNASVDPTHRNVIDADIAIMASPYSYAVLIAVIKAEFYDMDGLPLFRLLASLLNTGLNNHVVLWRFANSYQIDK